MSITFPLYQLITLSKLYPDGIWGEGARISNNSAKAERYWWMYKANLYAS